MASPEPGNDNDTDTVVLPTVALIWDEILPVLELCAGIDTLYTKKIPISGSCHVSGNNLTGLRDAASEVRAFLKPLIAVHFEEHRGSENTLAQAAFQHRQVAAVKRAKKVKVFGTKLGAMQSTVEKSMGYLDDEDLDGLQAKLKEVEQIISKKRKASEINGGGAGAN